MPVRHTCICCVDFSVAPHVDVSSGSVVKFDVERAGEAQKSLLSDFTSLVLQAKKELEQKVPVSEFCHRFLLELPASLKDEHKKFLQDNRQELSKQSTFDDLFYVLDLYWDYLNYNLLESVIKRQGSRASENKMEQYCIEVKRFRRSVTLTVFWELEGCISQREPPPGFELVKTKHHISPNSTLEDLNNIRLRITDEFHLPVFALYIMDIVKGSVCVTWLMPCSVAKLLKSELTGKLMNELGINEITFCSSDVDYKGEL